MSRAGIRENQHHVNQQSGIALIVVLVLIGLLVSVLAVGFTGDLARQNKKRQQTADALAKAKEALIGYAAKDPNQPGILPCPDRDNDGSADSPCGATGVTAIGRLPWKTLGLPDLRDGSGECLWYAVSANFKNSGTSAPAVVNSDSLGTLVVKDASGNPVYSGSNAVVAIVFSPDGALPGQNRTPNSATGCGGNSTAGNYLEGGNQNGASTNIFIAAQTTNTFNDELLPITSDALFSVVEMRVLREMRNALVTYRSNNSYFPGANPYADGTYSCDYLTYQGRLPLNINLGCTALADWGTDLPAWFGTNNWQNVTYYAVSPCQIGVGAIVLAPLTVLCAATVNLSVDGSNSVDAIAFTAGSRIAGQSRPCTSVSDCLEGSVNTDGNKVFVSPPIRSATNNDRLMIVWP